jgi:hypothetical protein
MARRAGNTKDADLTEFRLRQLVYGGPGSGKTWYGSTAPKPFFICIDDGLIRMKMLKKDIQYEEVDGFDDVENIINDIYMGKVAKGRETIILDHITDATDIAKDKVLAQNSAQAMNLQLWGFVSDYIKGIIRQLDGLRKYYHIVVLAQEELVKDKSNDELVGVPNTVGKLAFHIGAYYDMFLYAKQETGWDKGKPAPRWLLYPFDLGRYKAKDRLGVLGVAEENDFGVIYSKFKGGIYNATD